MIIRKIAHVSVLSVSPSSHTRAFHKMVSRHDCLDASKDGGNVSWVKVDLGKPSDAVESARQAVAWAGGTMDILVNNAGICVLEDFMDITSSSFDEIIAINTRAPLLVSQVNTIRTPRRGRSTSQRRSENGIHLTRRSEEKIAWRPYLSRQRPIRAIHFRGESL